jgi:hypothetical protein
MLDKVLLVSGAPVDPARLERVLYWPQPEASTVLAVEANGDPLQAIAEALRSFEPSRIVLAGADPRLDLTGEVEDRFGGPVMVVCRDSAPVGAPSRRRRG